MFIYCIWLNNVGYKIYEGYRIHSKRATSKMNPLFFHLVDFLYSLGLKFVAQVPTKRLRNFHVRKHVKLYIKTYVFTCCISGFLTKYLCIIIYGCEKPTATMKIIIIWIIQYLSLKFILFRFCIWKIAKPKSFNLVAKKWYPDCEYALVY
jgi:hypothetical protein